MILYTAGNFVTLNDVNKERAFKESIESRGKEYNRLVSFFHPRTCETLLTLKKEDLCKKKES